MVIRFERLILTELDRVFADIKHEITTMVVLWVVGTLLGAGVAEGVGIAVSGGALGWPIHLAAVCSGLILGYIAALTAVCGTVTRALVAISCWVTVEAERAASTAVHEIVDDAGAYIQAMSYVTASTPQAPAPDAPRQARPMTTRQFVEPLRPIMAKEAVN